MQPRLPRPLRPGERVGVAALSGPVDSERLERGVEALRALGYEPVLADNLLRTHRLFAGTDEERLAGFHGLLKREDVAAVIFARGGHGLLRLLPTIDFDLIGRRSLPLVGYSDLTPLLNSVVQRCGLVTFHGPMVATELAEEPLASEADALVEMLEGKVARSYDVETVGGGSVRGPLLGGCLSMLVATAGTPFVPALGGAVLLLEDVGEPLYRWDRMLTHLHLSSNLNGARALVFGHVSGVPGVDPQSWSTWLQDLAEDFELSICHRLQAGHARPNLILPLGVDSLLDFSLSRLTTYSPQADST
ncbi:MAG: LD-carboxypeptidase [Acidobacteriota bacterium]